MIRGRIVATDTGAPVRRAQIRAALGGARATRPVTSHADERYEIRDLPAGRWQLTASKGRFVAMRFGQRRPLLDLTLVGR